VPFHLIGGKPHHSLPQLPGLIRLPDPLPTFDLPFGEDGVRELAALLEQRCGTGGTVPEDGVFLEPRRNGSTKGPAS
jgi:hypothetical protein